MRRCVVGREPAYLARFAVTAVRLHEARTAQSPFHFGGIMRVTTIIPVTVLLLASAGCAGSSGATVDANKDLVRRFAEATNAADWHALSALVTENFTRHSAATAGPAVTSHEAFIALQQSFLASFPDQRVTLRQLVAEGDRVAVLATYSGTQTGPLGEFPATGKRVEAPFLGIFRIEGGQIAEMWVEWDNLAMLTQLGLFPPPAKPST
jgi:steroid delta-isomerase-like uncharacterized protein